MTNNSSEGKGGDASDGGPPSPRPAVDDNALIEAILRHSPAAPLQAPAPTTKIFRLPKVGDRVVSPNNSRTYVIGQTLGEGGFGVVYSATDDWENDLRSRC